MSASCRLCFFLFCFVCWSSYRGIAQGADRERAYTQQREATAHAADEQAHLEAARTNNLPNGSTSGGRSYGGSSEVAIRDGGGLAGQQASSQPAGLPGKRA